SKAAAPMKTKATLNKKVAPRKVSAKKGASIKKSYPVKKHPAGKSVHGTKLKAQKGKSRRAPPSRAILSESVLAIVKPIDVLFEDEPLGHLMPLLEKNDCVYLSKKYNITGRVDLSGAIGALMRKDYEELKAEQIKMPIIAIDKSKTIRFAFDTMKKNNIGNVIVKNKDDIIGCVDIRDIFRYTSKKLAATGMHKGGVIETNIDLFIAMLKKGPTTYAEVQERFGIKKDQIDEWIDVLEKENIIKVEKRLGKLKIKEDKK
ncbi:MAG: CBS domain-containing protein, partial [Candidatus Aenigmatarchaeota archaeon]